MHKAGRGLPQDVVEHIFVYLIGVPKTWQIRRDRATQPCAHLKNEIKITNPDTVLAEILL